ncbi:MAG: hypothetical protein LBL07_16310 [Tannerella sp.]|nr:hypothetical protein [Tannerella sp.]
MQDNSLKEAYPSIHGHGTSSRNPLRQDENIHALHGRVNVYRPAYYSDRTLKGMFATNNDFYFSVSPFRYRHTHLQASGMDSKNMITRIFITGFLLFLSSGLPVQQ